MYASTHAPAVLKIIDCTLFSEEMGAYLRLFALSCPVLFNQSTRLLATYIHTRHFFSALDFLYLLRLLRFFLLSFHIIVSSLVFNFFDL